MKQATCERGKPANASNLNHAGVRTLVLPRQATAAPEQELRRLITADAVPDGVSAHAAIGATFLNDHFFAAIPGLHGRIVRRLPFLVAQLIEVLIHAKEYDAVLTWTEPPAILIAGLMFIWRRSPAHVTIWMWPSKPKKAIPLRLVRRQIDRVIMWSPVQRRFAEAGLGIPAERFVDVKYPVDATFWRPMMAPADSICSVGQEMRDYGTLLDALQTLDIHCHIAAGTSAYGTAQDKWWQSTVGDRTMPAGVTVGQKSYVELRELYARSRFVVVPLLPSEADNGMTAITEAFAMGKAVICTEIAGHVDGDLLQSGVNCLKVPPFDAKALRGAIGALWNDPEKCHRFGAAGRRRVVESHGLDQYTAGLVRAVDEAVAARAAAARARVRRAAN